MRRLRCDRTSVSSQQFTSARPRRGAEPLGNFTADRCGLPAGVLTLAAHTVLYRENEPAPAVYLLLSGRMRLITGSINGPSIATALLRPGALLGLNALSQPHHSETARTDTACAIQILPLAAVNHLLERQPRLGALLIEALLRRRAAAERQLTRALLIDVPGRLAGALLDEAEGNTVTGLTRRRLAEAAWTTRETATRILFRFAARGFVRIDGRTVDLLNPDGLRELAAGARCSDERDRSHDRTCQCAPRAGAPG